MLSKIWSQTIGMLRCRCIASLRTTFVRTGLSICILVAAFTWQVHPSAAIASDSSVGKAKSATATQFPKPVKFVDIKDVTGISAPDRRRIFGEDVTDKWYVGRVDINGDGRDDYFLWSHDECGTIGCSFHIMVSQGTKDWKKMADLFIQGSGLASSPVTILGSKYLGYHDLSPVTFCHLPCNLWAGTLRFDGKDYATYESSTVEQWYGSSTVSVERIRDPRTKVERILDVR